MILSVAALIFAVAGYAQNSAVQSARNYLKENDYDNAIKYINQAAQDPSTKDKPKTWNTMGDIYLQMMMDPKYADRMPYKDAAKAYMKVSELDPAYEKDEVTQKLSAAAIGYYNDAIKASQANKYDEAIDLAVNVNKIFALKRFAANKSADTIAAVSKQIQAYSYYNQKKYPEAIAAFNELKGSPVYKSINDKSGSPSNMYILLANMYNETGKTAEQLAIIEEGRKVYPNDPNLIREELNYYIITKQEDILLKKLEDAAAKDPSNVDIQYRLANIYNGIALPNKEGVTAPANSKELIVKAEEAYKKAIAADPNNPEYNFNYGLLFYNQAVQTTMAMNAIEGSDAASMKKYDALKATRDAQFKQALPYIEKANSVLDAKASSLNDQDKQIYINTLRGLQEIYAKLGQAEKSSEMKKKLDANK